MTRNRGSGGRRRARLGILLSGRGSNFLALHAAIERGEIDATIAVVLSNHEEAPGLAKARSLGIEARALPHQGMRRRRHDAAMVAALQEAAVDWVCLAGYMRILTPTFIGAFPNRILNIHPSLLPAFPGLDAQVQAWDYGVKVSGCTVHLVDQGMDTGPIVVQYPVSMEGLASAAELSARILEQEHRAYPAALQLLLSKDWQVKGRRVVFDD